MTDQVYVYRLCDEATLSTRADMLRQHLTAPGPGKPLQPVFAAMPAGCFRYFDRGRMMRNSAPQLLAKDAEAAMQMAQDYMRAVNDAAARYRAARRIELAKYPDPFAVGQLARGSARLVRSPSTGRDDHWLTTWGLRLAASPQVGSQPVTVIGATVEIRVGPQGQVVGVVSQVRPWMSVLTRPAYSWKGDGHDHDHDHGGEGNGHDDDHPLSLIHI